MPRIPREWLFTDDRLGGQKPADPLWRAIGKLPRGGGIVFRHYGWPAKARMRLFREVAALARRRGLVLVASELPLARGGVHRPAGSRARRCGGLVTAAAHGLRDAKMAFAHGADLLFLSPVFATRSHPGAAPLGPVRFGLICTRLPGPVLALGGMDKGRARRLAALGARGFGAIDGWI